MDDLASRVQRLEARTEALVGACEAMTSLLRETLAIMKDCHITPRQLPEDGLPSRHDVA